MTTPADGAGSAPTGSWTGPALVYFASTGGQVEVSAGDLGALEGREQAFLRTLLRTGKRRLDEVAP